MTETAVGAGLHLTGLRKTYRTPSGPVEAVRGVDLAVEPGETVALLGPNGAGKSTTVDMLLGLQTPDAGTATFFGRAPQEAVRAGLVGAMLQTGAVIRDLTVRELVSMMAALYPTPLPVDEALRHAGLLELAERRTEKLSGGQTQRVRFAVALVTNPDLLVLDEPTVGMDVETRQQFWSTVRAFAAEWTTVLFAPPSLPRGVGVRGVPGVVMSDRLSTVVSVSPPRVIRPAVRRSATRTCPAGSRPAR